MFSGRLPYPFRSFSSVALLYSFLAFFVGCGAPLGFTANTKLSTGIENDTFFQSASSEATVLPSSESDKTQRVLVSETSDSKLSVTLSSSSAPLFSNGSLNFVSQLELPIFSRDTEERLLQSAKQTLEIYRPDSSRAYQESKFGSKLDWNLNALKDGSYRFRVLAELIMEGKELEKPGIELPEPLEFFVVVDTKAPEFTVEHSFSSGTVVGESLLTIRVSQPLQKENSSIENAETESLRNCDPVSVFRKESVDLPIDNVDLPIASVFLNPDSFGNFVSSELVLPSKVTGALEGKESAEAETIVASVKCYDRAGNGLLKTTSFRPNMLPIDFSLALAGKLPFRGVPLEEAASAASLDFLGEDSSFASGVDLKLNLFTKEKSGADINDRLVSRYGNSLKLGYKVFPGKVSGTIEAQGALEPGTNLYSFSSTLNVPLNAFGAYTGYINVAVYLYQIVNEKELLISSQAFELYRDNTPPNIEFEKLEKRVRAEKGAEIQFAFSTQSIGAPIIKSEVEYSNNALDWAPMPSALIQSDSTRNLFQARIKYPFEREVPFRVRVKSTDALGRTTRSKESMAFTLSSNYTPSLQASIGAQLPECQNSVGAGKAIPKLSLRSELVCHDTASTLGAAPYVRVLIGLENAGDSPFVLAAGKSTLNLRVVTGTGLLQTVSVNIAQISGKSHSDLQAKPFQFAVPLNIALLSAEKIWIEWDQSNSVFDTQNTCTIPSTGRPRLDIQDTLIDKELIFDPFGCD